MEGETQTDAWKPASRKNGGKKKKRLTNELTVVY